MYTVYPGLPAVSEENTLVHEREYTVLLRQFPITSAGKLVKTKK